MPQNLIAAQRGRFQSRLSRLVDIHTSKIIQEPVPGQPGKTVPRTIWLGTLYASNGKTPEGTYEWEESGAFRNQRGVSSPNDLAIYVGKYPGQQDDAPDELLSKLVQSPGNVMQNLETPAPAAPAPAQVDNRLTLLIGGFVVDLYDELIAVASAAGLDVTGRPPLIRGPWIEAVNETLVAIMDSPASVHPVHADKADNADKTLTDGQEPNGPASGDGIAHDPSAAV